MGKLFLQIIGKSGSGKSEVVSCLESELGFSVARPSDFIREFAQQEGLPLDCRTDYSRAHIAMTERMGRYALAKKVAEVEGQNVAVDGLRVPAHAEFLRDYYPPSPVVALVCPDEVRLERKVARSRDIDSTALDLTAMLTEEAAETHGNGNLGINVDAVMAMADERYRIDSSRPLDFVLEQAVAIAKQHMS